MSTAEKIALLRKKKGISQEELAHELNTSRQAISKWENAQSTPDLNKLVRLKLEVTEEEYRYAADEAKRKKHFFYWVPVIASFLVILAVFLYYYCFYC